MFFVRLFFADRHALVIGRPSRGFTLVELMVVIAIAAVLLGLAVPGLQSFLQSNQLTGLTDSFATALSEARSQAAKLGTTVTLAASGGTNWGANSWTMTVNQNASGNPTSTLRTGPAAPANYTVFANAAGTNGLTFDSSGQLVQNPPASVEIVVCQNGGPANGGAARMILVAPNGRVQIAQNDSAGNPLDPSGNTVGCQP